MLSYLDWLRTHRTYWRTLQGPLVEELQAAMLSASMQSCMLAQALNSCKREYRATDRNVEGDRGLGLTPSEEVQRAAELVDFGRLMQEHGDTWGGWNPRQSAMYVPVMPWKRGRRSAERWKLHGHEVDREGGSGSGERDDTDLSSFMQGSAPWRKRPASDTVPSRLTTAVRRLTPPTSSGGGSQQFFRGRAVG